MLVPVLLPCLLRVPRRTAGGPYVFVCDGYTEVFSRFNLGVLWWKIVLVLRRVGFAKITPATKHSEGYTE